MAEVRSQKAGTPAGKPAGKPAAKGGAAPQGTKTAAAPKPAPKAPAAPAVVESLTVQFKDIGAPKLTPITAGKSNLTNVEDLALTSFLIPGMTPAQFAPLKKELMEMGVPVGDYGESTLKGRAGTVVHIYHPRDPNASESHFWRTTANTPQGEFRRLIKKALKDVVVAAKGKEPEKLIWDERFTAMGMPIPAEYVRPQAQRSANAAAAKEQKAKEAADRKAAAAAKKNGNGKAAPATAASGGQKKSGGKRTAAAAGAQRPAG